MTLKSNCDRPRDNIGSIELPGDGGYVTYHKTPTENLQRYNAATKEQRMNLFKKMSSYQCSYLSTNLTSSFHN